jgi:hypothetical protein
MNEFEFIDKNLFIIGFCSLINAYGIRFIWDDLDSANKEWMLSAGLKRIVIFTLFFVSTRSLVVSSILLIIYINIIKFLKRKKVISHPVFN